MYSRDSSRDELRPAPISGRGDGAGQILLPERAPDVDELARLDVGADGDNQVGEAFEGRLAHGRRC
jgi:hypothetical protein